MPVNLQISEMSVVLTRQKNECSLFKGQIVSYLIPYNKL